MIHDPRFQASLRELADAGAVTCIAGRTTVWDIGPEQHLVAAFYRNTAAHFLVGRAVRPSTATGRVSRSSCCTA